MSPPSQFNLFARGRDSDIVWKDDAAWMAHAIPLVEKYLPHGEVMGQDIQCIIGIGKPRSQHSWGRLTSRLKHRGILQETGRFKKSTRRDNKAHKYEIYWREGYPDE